MGTFQYVSIEDALELHAVVLGLTRGTLGVRDMGGLAGSLERAKASFGGADMFPTIFEKAGAYVESVARNHPFLDGNKRTAFLIGAAFLDKNNYELTPKEGEIEECVLWIVTQKPPMPEIALWFKERSIKRST